MYDPYSIFHFVHGTDFILGHYLHALKYMYDGFPLVIAEVLLVNWMKIWILVWIYQNLELIL